MTGPLSQGAGSADLDGLAVGCLQDVSWTHAAAVYHVLARRCDDVHLQSAAHAALHNIALLNSSSVGVTAAPERQVDHCT